MKIKEFILAGFKVQVYDFGYAQYYYPAFNGNVEFKVSSKGFRELSHYLRRLNYFEKLMKCIKQK